MRVISGIARGRTLKPVPGMGTRPTTDKVKEALFSMIGPYFEGGAVLDLFGGTGGLGIEALSRGMDTGVFIDADRKALETMKHNLQVTGFADRAETYRNDAFRALKALQKREQRFDLVFLDPPYKMKIIGDLLQELEQLSLMNPGGTAVCEFDAEDRYPDVIGGFAAVRHSVYGDTAIQVYRYSEGEEIAGQGDEKP